MLRILDVRNLHSTYFIDGGRRGMDIGTVKQKIDQMEEQGHYNEAIEWLYEQWIADKNNPTLCEIAHSRMRMAVRLSGRI